MEMDKDYFDKKSMYKKYIPFGYRYSAMYCNGGYPDRQECGWYHSNWMLYRYLGIVSNPYWHEQFYKNAISKAYSRFSTTGKVLVAGTADFSMPLLCTEAGVKSIDVCDICETPIRICNEVSSDNQFDWCCYRMNIFDLPDNTYNIIVNDAFLSRFEDKVSVLMSINRALCCDGYYITTLKKALNKIDTIDYEAGREAFINKAIKRYEQQDHLPSIDIAKAARNYTVRMTSSPIHDKVQLGELFTRAGFRIVSLECSLVEGEYNPSEYFRIVAQKAY